jgi:tetratricopeptide (TPR) repeat protein
MIALERGNSEVAAACFQDAADRDATLVEAYVQLAGIHGRSRRYAQAEACLVEALARAPDDRTVAAALEKVRAERAAQ